MARKEPPESTGKRVCIAVDDSERSVHAFNFYMENLARAEDYLVFVHCPEMPYTQADASPEELHRMLVRLRHQSIELEQKFQRLMFERGILQGLFRTGDGKPGEVITKIAKEEKCDLIVSGSRGLDKFKRFILGSVSDYLIHHSHCPVLICRVQD